MKKFLGMIGIIMLFAFTSCSNDESTKLDETVQTTMHAKGEGGIDPTLSEEIISVTNQLVDELHHNQNPPENETYRLVCHKYLPDGLGGHGIFKWNGRYFYFNWYKDTILDLWEVSAGSVDSGAACNTL